jgi:hypothetical protein
MSGKRDENQGGEGLSFRLSPERLGQLPQVQAQHTKVFHLVNCSELVLCHFGQEYN